MLLDHMQRFRLRSREVGKILRPIAVEVGFLVRLAFNFVVNARTNGLPALYDHVREPFSHDERSVSRLIYSLTGSIYSWTTAVVRRRRRLHFTSEAKHTLHGALHN